MTKMMTMTMTMTMMMMMMMNENGAHLKYNRQHMIKHILSDLNNIDDNGSDTDNIHCWLVVGPPLWKIWKSVGIIIPNISGKIKLMATKPPTRESILDILGLFLGWRYHLLPFEISLLDDPSHLHFYPCLGGRGVVRLASCQGGIGLQIEQQMEM